jgi:hypothetical protein
MSALPVPIRASRGERLFRTIEMSDFERSRVKIFRWHFSPFVTQESGAKRRRKIRFGPFTYPFSRDRAVARWAAVASAHALRTAPRRCRREPRDLVPCATRETSRLASARTPRMVPPSPHAGPGTATPHHGSIWGNNKENAAGVTPGPMAYGTTPGAKTNAESVAEVRRRPDTSVTRVSAPIPRPRARRRPRLDP